MLKTLEKCSTYLSTTGFRLSGGLKAAHHPSDRRWQQAVEISSTPDLSGNPLIHLAELQRVYPKLTIATGDAIGQMPQVLHDATGQTHHATVQMHADNRVLQVQLEAKDREAEDLRRQLREEKERHDETRTEKARFLDMLEEAQKRIPAPPAPVEITPVKGQLPKRGFCARFTGK